VMLGPDAACQQYVVALIDLLHPVPRWASHCGQTIGQSDAL
jgi:hypothetical protein